MDLVVYHRRHVLCLVLHAIFFLSCSLLWGSVTCKMDHDPKRSWRLELSDTRTFAGRYFEYILPSLELNVSSQSKEFQYQISEVGTNSIPRWLVFEEASSTLKGIPSITEEGFYLMKASVLHHSGSDADVLTSDVFAIDVAIESNRQLTRDEILNKLEPVPHQIPNKMKQLKEKINCKRNEIKTRMSVMFATSLSGLNGSSRVTLLSRLSDFLTLPLNQFSVDSKSSSVIDVSRQSDTLATGPGNNYNHPPGVDVHVSDGLVISWPLPCATHELLKQFPNVMSRNVASGHLKNASGYDVCGWYIKKVDGAVQRREKREVHMTVMPTPRPSQTATVVSITTILTSTFPSTNLMRSQYTFSSLYASITPSSSTQFQTRTVSSTSPFVISTSSPPMFFSTSLAELPSSLSIGLTPSNVLSQTISSLSEISVSSSYAVSSTAIGQVTSSSTMLPETTVMISPSMPVLQTSQSRETHFFSSSQMPDFSTMNFISPSEDLMTYISPSLNSSLHISPTPSFGSMTSLASSTRVLVSSTVPMTSFIETSSNGLDVQSTVPLTTLPQSTLESSQTSSYMLQQSTSYSSRLASSLLYLTTVSFPTPYVSSSVSSEITVSSTLEISTQSLRTDYDSSLISFQPRTTVISSLAITDATSMISSFTSFEESTKLATETRSSEVLYSSVSPEMSSVAMTSIPVYHTTQISSEASSDIMSSAASMPSTMSESSSMQSTVVASRGPSSIPFVLTTSFGIGSSERTISSSLSIEPTSTVPIQSSFYSSGIQSTPTFGTSTRDTSSSLPDYMRTSATFPSTSGPSDTLLTTSSISESRTGVFTMTPSSQLLLSTSTGMPSIDLSTLSSSATRVFTFSGESSPPVTPASSAEMLSTPIISSTSASTSELTFSPPFVSSSVVLSPAITSSGGLTSALSSRINTETSASSGVDLTSMYSLLPTASSSESPSAHITSRMLTVTENSFSPSSGVSGLSTIVSTSPMISTSDIGTLSFSTEICKVSSLPSISSQLFSRGPSQSTIMSSLTTGISAMPTGSLTSLSIQSTVSPISATTLFSTPLRSDVTVMSTPVTSSAEMAPSTSTAITSMALTPSLLTLTSQRSTEMISSGYLESTDIISPQYSSTGIQTSVPYSASISTSYLISRPTESPYSTSSAIASSRVLSSMEQSRSPEVMTSTLGESQTSLPFSVFSSSPDISVTSMPTSLQTSSGGIVISQMTSTSLIQQSQTSLPPLTFSSRPDISVTSTPTSLQPSSVGTLISQSASSSLLSLPTMTDTPHSQLPTSTFVLQTSSVAGLRSSTMSVSPSHSSVSSGLGSILSSSPLIVTTQVSPSTTLSPTSAVDVSSSLETLQSTLQPSPTQPAPTSVGISTPMLSSLPGSGYTSSSLPSVMSTSDLLPITSASSRFDVSTSPVLMTSNPTTQTPTVTTEAQNQKPILQHPIDVIKTVQGDVLMFKIPPDTFFDPEDGSTYDLQLALLTVGNKQVGASNWLQLDSSNNILFGVPLDNNLTSTRNEYLLSATDSQGLVSYDAFVVQVQKRPSDFTHEFVITLENNFEDFVSDQTYIVQLCEEIASFLGDRDAGAMSVQSVEKGSVDVSYSNKTISREICDEETINGIYANLVDSDGLPKSAFQDTLAPKFIVTSVDLVLLYLCENVTIPSTNGTIPRAGESSIVLVTIVPAVVIAAILIICFIIVCCFYKRKRGGEEFLLPNEKSIYAKNRKPVYLDGELEDKGQWGVSNPVVLPVDLELLQSSKPLQRSGRPSTIKQQPPPPQYRLPDYAKVDLEMNAIDVGGAHMMEPPEYSSNPFLFSNHHGTKTISAVSLSSAQSDKPPPLYQLPPAYHSQDAGFFDDSVL